MATGVSAPGRAQVGLKTARSDRWWLAPLRIGVILLFFIVYATIRIFMNKWYWVGDYHYLTPLYSPSWTRPASPAAACPPPATSAPGSATSRASCRSA